MCYLIWFYICIELCVSENMSSICFGIMCADRMNARNFKCIFLAFASLWPLWCVCSIEVVVARDKRTHSDTRLCSIDVLFLEVNTHLSSTETLTRAHTHWRTLRGAAMAKECTPDCFLPPPHRRLRLQNNQLSSLPDSVFGGLSALT